jgi:hypothetical protein
MRSVRHVGTVWHASVSAVLPTAALPLLLLVLVLIVLLFV